MTNPEDSNEPHSSLLVEMHKESLVIKVAEEQESQIDYEEEKDLLLGGVLEALKAQQEAVKALAPEPEERVFVVIFAGAQLQVLATNPTLVSDHMKHLANLARSGTLGPYGPFNDYNRGFAIFFAESKGDVEKHLMDDPLIINKYYTSYEILELMALRV